MAENIPDSLPAPSLTQLLAAELSREAQEHSCLTPFNDYRVESADKFPGLNSKDFRYLQETLPLYKDLPKAPTLGDLSSLSHKFGPSQFKQQFEDTWTSTNLGKEIHEDL